MKKLNYGEYLRKARKARGLNQEEFSELIGISQTTYSRIENGIVIPPQEVFDKIAGVLESTQAVSIPVIEPLEYDTLVATRGLGIGRILSGPTGNVVNIIAKIVFALLFADVAFQFVQGFCDGFKTTEQTKLIASWVSAVIMLGIYYYWLKKIEKRWQV